MEPAKILQTLKSVFGFQEFRPNQREIITEVLGKRDVFAVMPTGGGKSLCYQLPARIFEGTTVVISPLISLMKDQVDGARENGIAATCINSAMESHEISRAFRDLHQGQLELLYISPERFALPQFMDTLREVKISLFAIDEAHCISEWGHDFRPDYLHLSCIPDEFPDVPMAAFTATATQKVQHDIIEKLRLRDPFSVRASFNRDNLFYEVRRKKGYKKHLLNFLKERPGEPGIIYRTTRDSVEKLAKWLNEKGVQALPYHAGLEPEIRQGNQEAFNRDEVEIIVATIAFGMGIDKSNVRFVIHLDCPKNLENYYQETGRSGRDGEPAYCLFYYSRGDIPKIRYFIDQIVDDHEREIALQKVNQVAKYATHNICRRRQILGYFDEEYPEDNCGQCDICEGTVEKVNATVDAQILLSAVARTHQAYGIQHVINVVVGSNAKRIKELKHDKIKTHGAGKHRARPFWGSLVDELLAREYLRQEGAPYPVLKITDKGYELMYGRDELVILKREEPSTKGKKSKSRKEKELGPYDRKLFKELRELRKELAQEQDVPPFLIFSDKTLHEMCRRYPSHLGEIVQITGVGQVKLARYGKQFTKVIQDYLASHPDLEANKEPFEVSDYIDEPDFDLPPLKKKKKKKKRVTSSKKVSRGKGKDRISDSMVETLDLFEQGLSIEEIAQKRCFAPSAIANHLEKLIKTGKITDISELVEPDQQRAIEGLFQSLQTWSAAPIVEYLGGQVSFNEVRFTRARLQFKNPHL